MIDNQTLIDAIEKSPLKPEDKDHWKSLLPKLTDEQKSRLHHSLAVKTEISRAISLIEKALNIIAEAESEAEKEVKKEEEAKLEKKQLLEELEAIKEKEDEILLDEEVLKKKQEETQAQIEAIRQELHDLSVEIHGAPPPSYSKKPPSPQIPQLKSK
jgi:predicted RNase H-like nuclease (RuvC/YqgF family)